MNENTNVDIPRSETVIRFLFVVLFALIYSVAEIVLLTVIIIQFGFQLITRDRNQMVHEFGVSVGDYIYQIVRYATFRSEEKPFPFSTWPTGKQVV